MSRKDYYVNVHVINLKTDEAEDKIEINFSSPHGRDNLNRLIFKALNTGKGVAIELDRTEPASA